MESLKDVPLLSAKSSVSDAASTCVRREQSAMDPYSSKIFKYFNTIFKVFHLFVLREKE